jgi:antitoxin PrlF
MASISIYSNIGKSKTKQRDHMRITSKGQVTIPQEIRDKAGLLPGVEVEFTLEGDNVCVLKSKPGGRGKELIERMRGKGSVRMTTDETMALTRG